MVTPEMLLWLAGKVGIAVEMRGSFVCLAYGGKAYEPHRDDAQFGRLVVMCPSLGVSLLITDGYTCASGTNHESPRMEHDDTPDSIRAAAVVAVCRALGFQEEGDASK